MKTSKKKSATKSARSLTGLREVNETFQPAKDDLAYLDWHPLLIESKKYRISIERELLAIPVGLKRYRNESFLSDNKRQYELSLNDLQLPMRLFESLRCLTDVIAILFKRDYLNENSSMTPYLLLTMEQVERNNFLERLALPKIPNDNDVRTVGALLNWMRSKPQVNKSLLCTEDHSLDVTEFLILSELASTTFTQMNDNALHMFRNLKNLGEVLLLLEVKGITYRVAYEHVWLFLTMDNDSRKKVLRIINKGIKARGGSPIPMVNDREVRTVGAYMEWMDRAATSVESAYDKRELVFNANGELRFLLNDTIKKEFAWKYIGETISSRHEKRIPLNIDVLHTVGENVKIKILENFQLKLRDISKLLDITELNFFMESDTNLTLIRKVSLFSPFWKVLMKTPSERVKYLADCGVWSWKTRNPKQTLEKVKNIGELLIWMNKHGVWSNEWAKVEQKLSELERGEEKDKYLKHKAELEELNAERERLLAIVKPAEKSKQTKKIE